MNQNPTEDPTEDPSASTSNARNKPFHNHVSPALAPNSPVTAPSRTPPRLRPPPLVLKFSQGTGWHDCFECASGKFSPAGAAGCTSCEAGKSLFTDTKQTALHQPTNEGVVPTLWPRKSATSVKRASTQTKQVQTLPMANGFWRTTKSSTEILACLNPKHCKGADTADLCSEGYTGPL
ncbi:hypothetical protein TrLO_g3980 [Triparma laevis f. longispina]|uniref:Tyrosine-protein kinase ephrin type A/B receptor-like domain-containing protein n=1 Tax=Triparma laevis f. longispina TaxID=1714387 RepID=A0A9W6ZAR0_9STRA|nr:hypothetical protein TrLO_g3980 [Triparma laevis f. longispina]